MKSRCIKKLIASLLVLAFTLPSLALMAADYGEEALEVSAKRVFIDGQEVATSERGNMPLLIDGTKHMSVRAMGTAFGHMPVHWEPTAGTLHFGRRGDFSQTTYLLAITIGEHGWFEIHLDEVLELDIRDFTVIDRGNERHFIGVPLADVFALRGVYPAYTDSLIFIAADGMSTTATAEEALNPANGFLVIGEDGEQFISREAGGNGPFMVVFAEDGVPGRWARMLKEIIVVREGDSNLLNRWTAIFANGYLVGGFYDGFMPMGLWVGGVLYMPLEATAIALGFEVGFNAAVNAIYIGEAPDEFDALADGWLAVYADGQRLLITKAEIESLGIVEFYATIRGERRDYTGVPIAAIMEFLGVDYAAATGLVTFGTMDGHGTAGTADETFDRENGFIALSEAGEPLGHWEHGGRGPFMLVYANDVFPQRFMRYLITITVDAPVLDEYFITAIEIAGRRYPVDIELLRYLGAEPIVAQDRNWTGTPMYLLIEHFEIDLSDVIEGVIIAGNGFSQPFTVDELLDTTNFFLAFEEDEVLIEADERGSRIMSAFTGDERNTRRVRGVATIRLVVANDIETPDVASVIEGLEDGEFVILRGADTWTVTMDDLVALGFENFSSTIGANTRHFTGVRLVAILESKNIGLEGATGFITTSWGSVFQAAWNIAADLDDIFIVVAEDGEVLDAHSGPFFGVVVDRMGNFNPRNLQSIRIN